MAPTSLQGMYERMGMFGNSTNGSTEGTGVLPNGTQDGNINGGSFDMIAYMMSFEGPIDGRVEVSGSVHAGVGTQAMLTSAGIAAESPAVCAQAESGTCNVTGGIREVIYGANGSYVSGVFSGPVACDLATFQTDPDYGVYKSCALRGAALTQCAAQGGTCLVNGLTEVFYSTGSGPAQVLVTRANTPCAAASFGAPAGTLGSCYERPAREWSRVMTLLQLAQNGEVGLVYQTSVNGIPRGGYYVGAGVFQSDNILTQVTLQNLYTWVVNGQPVQLTLVPRGSEYRVGVDANLNGRLNGDELAAGANPRTQAAGAWAECAPENGTCTFSGAHVVRFGMNGTYTYRVATNSVSCSATVFGDPDSGVVKECDVAN
jgi:hypothetical protein